MNLNEKQILHIVKSLRRYGDTLAKEAKKQKTEKIYFCPSTTDLLKILENQLDQLESRFANEYASQSYHYAADAIMNIATGTWKEMPK